MHKVSEIAGVKFIGYRLEQHFEPEKIDTSEEGFIVRSCKWDRYVRGLVSPSPATIAMIENRYPVENLSRLYHSALWRALAAGEQSETYWTQLYKNLRLSLQCHIYKATPDANSPFQRKKLRSSDIKAIQKEGDLEALACLFALLRDGHVRSPSFIYQEVELAAYNLLLWTMRHNWLFPFLSEFWDYLKSHIIEINRSYFHHYSMWNDHPTKTIPMISSLIQCLSLADELNIIDPDKESNIFLFWFYQGKIRLILEEMDEASKAEKYELKNSRLGLKWLVGKLNSSRPKSRRMGNIIYSTNETHQ